MPERRYRDPVHNIIYLNEDSPEDRLLAALIDSKEFQRLRRIRQLGFAFYIYQGAEHSRFAHSLGVMHITTRILRQLGQQIKITPEAQLAIRVSALLHDLGHGPFSHVMETVLGFHHEDWTIQILQDSTTEVHQILSAFQSNLPEVVISVIEGRFKPSCLGQLVSSQLDCDRFDYLLRDSLMTGAKYGNYDLEWIISSLAISEQEDMLYVRGRGLYAIEEYLQSRYYMFRQVYFHHTLRAVDNMLISIIRRAKELAKQKQLKFIGPGSAIEKLIQILPMSTSDFLELDDSDLIFSIKQWQRETDPLLSNLCKSLINRHLFKSLDLSNLNESEKENFIDHVTILIEKAGFDSDYYLLEDKATDVPYFGPYTPDAPSPHARIYVETGKINPKLHEITEISHVVREMRSYQISRLCFPEEIRNSIFDCANKLELTSKI